MSISNREELDAVLAEMTLKIDRLLNEGGHRSELVEANRNLKRLGEYLKKHEKPTGGQVKSLLAATSLIRDKFQNDDRLCDQSFDVEDFVQAMGTE